MTTRKMEEALANLQAQVARVTKAVKIVKEGGANDSDMGEDGEVASTSGINPAVAARIFAAGVAAGLQGRNKRRGQRNLDIGGVGYTDTPSSPNEAVLGDKAATAYRSVNAWRLRTAGLSKALGIQAQGPGDSGRSTTIEKSEGNSKHSTDPLPYSTLKSITGASVKKSEGKTQANLVLEAAKAGANSAREIAQKTGLSKTEVIAALARLEGDGLLMVE